MCKHHLGFVLQMGPNETYQFACKLGCGYTRNWDDRYPGIRYVDRSNDPTKKTLPEIDYKAGKH